MHFTFLNNLRKKERKKERQSFVVIELKQTKENAIKNLLQFIIQLKSF